MPAPLNALIVIPSRYGSTRFPGKPLHRIAGHTLLERVVDLARTATRDDADVRIVVATDHAAILDHATAIGCDAVMTDSAITSGTGRALSAARAEHTPPAIVLNLQGDAPFVPADAIHRLLDTLRTTDAEAATSVLQLDWPQLDALRAHKVGSPFSGTTCVRATDGQALWFSKAILPAIRDEAALRATDRLSPVYRHLGLYAYRLAALERFEATPPSRYETLEGLEQLRLLELGLRMQTVTVGAQHIPISGIDTQEDAALAERLIAEHGDPFGGG